MPVASCVATGTACGRHPVASLLSMPVASCVATGTACGVAIRSHLLSMPVASGRHDCGRHPVALPSMPASASQRARPAAAIRSHLCCRCERTFPPNASPTCFSCLCPKTGHRLFCFDHPRTEERSQRARPLRSCPDTAGCRPLRHALRAWIRRLPVVRPATAIASSTGPGYHALPTPGPPAATHDDSPAARRRDRHTQPDKRIGEGGADRMVAARPWPSERRCREGKGTKCFKNSFSPLARKEAP